MRDHLLWLANTHDNHEWDGTIESGFESILAGHFKKYHMASQTVTHLAAAGGTTNSDHSRPAIELF
jgi:hypothetical protein